MTSRQRRRRRRLQRKRSAINYEGLTKREKRKKMKGKRVGRLGRGPAGLDEGRPYLQGLHCLERDYCGSLAAGQRNPSFGGRRLPIKMESPSLIGQCKEWTRASSSLIGRRHANVTRVIQIDPLQRESHANHVRPFQRKIT